jgi:hypothetical protein
MYFNLAELLQQSGQTVNPEHFINVPRLTAQENQLQLQRQNDPSQSIPSTHSNPNQFIDVHSFDYSYANQDHEVVNMTVDRKIQWINRLIQIMNDSQARYGAELILANIGNLANQDRTNNKTAEDLLVLLAQYMTKDQSLLPLVEEQLSDMVQLGQCAQGRTTRLWQLYVSLPK